MHRGGSTRYRKRPPYATRRVDALSQAPAVCNATGRRVTASARRMQRHRVDALPQAPPVCNATGRRVTARGRRVIARGRWHVMRRVLALPQAPAVCNATGRRVTARGRSHVMRRVLALLAGVSRMQHVVFMRYRLARSRNRFGVHALPLAQGAKPGPGSCVTASPGINTASGSCVDPCGRCMMRPDVVIRLLILLLMNHLHHLHLVHHFNNPVRAGRRCRDTRAFF
jgi:hypothetical protein